MYKFLAFIFSLTFLNNSISYSQSIEGDWTLTDRKCESAISWESVNGVTMSINLTTNTHNLIMIEDECALIKIGSISQISPTQITFCKPVAHAMGSCSQRILDHVVSVNKIQSQCTDQREVKFSDDGNKMVFSEKIKNEGFACPVGEDLIYQFERIQN